jgi:hypothetical protein
LIPGREQSHAQLVIRVGIDCRKQAVALAIYPNYRLVYCNVIRVPSLSRM